MIPAIHVRARCGALLPAIVLLCGAGLDARAGEPQRRPSRAARPGEHSETIVVRAAQMPPAPARPAGQTTYSADRLDFANHAAQSVADMVATIPGVSVLAGNGPRDVVVSVRGSGNRQSYGLRNIQVTEDGFPVTQPDGTARSDLIDPHAYAGVDVFEGPASTVHGNYAINGAINFRTRDGADLDGVEFGSDFGSYGMVNNFLSAGTGNARYDIMAFASDVRGDGATANTRYETTTENLKLGVSLTSSDRLTLKFVNNVTDAYLSPRLSLAQYRVNPYQQGCVDAAHAAAGCAAVSLRLDGRTGPTVPVSAEAAGLGRFDRRTIVGLRWVHDFDAHTSWRNQFTYDQRHIDQPTSAVSYTGPYNSYAASSDLTNTVRAGRTNLVSFVGVNYDYLDFGSLVYNLTPAGGAARGALNSTQFGHQSNAGGRFQEDWGFAPHWHLIVGLGGTYSEIGATQTLLSYSATTTRAQVVTADRSFFNLAPEAALTYAPRADTLLNLRIGTAYATPGSSNLFITPQGTYGNNTQLRSETSLGVDLGVKWHPSRALTLQATGFYEFYNDEFVSQSAGVNAVGAYSFNAPASQHRGVVFGGRWQPLPGRLPGARLGLSYTFDDQIYTDYTETLSNSTQSRSFDRAGNRIPGVIPHFLDGRVLYDQPDGRFEGLGGFAEVVWRSGFWLDNANILRAPSAATLNLELHYDPPARLGWLHRLHTYIEVQNVADSVFVAGATNIADVLTASGLQAGAGVLATRTGSIYAGAPRSVFGGVRIRL